MAGVERGVGVVGCGVMSSRNVGAVVVAVLLRRTSLSPYTNNVRTLTDGSTPRDILGERGSHRPKPNRVESEHAGAERCDDVAWTRGENIVGSSAATSSSADKSANASAC